MKYKRKAGSHAVRYLMDQTRGSMLHCAQVTWQPKLDLAMKLADDNKPLIGCQTATHTERYKYIYHVYLPPEACETLKGFLAVVGDFKKAEFKVGCLRLTDGREEVAKPTTVEVAAAIVVGLIE